MSVNWNLLLARYQQTRGGYFLGSKYDECDSRLLIPQEDRPHLLIELDVDRAGRASYSALTGRTAVQLNGTYELSIGPRGLVGSGVSGIMGALGKGDFGYPEATKGRVITTNNKAFTKLVLGDLELRNALIKQEKISLRITPSALEEGWHVVEVCAADFEALNSGWVTDAITQSQSISFMSLEDQNVLLTAADRDFQPRMDGLIDFLRAAQRAVTVWRM